MYKRELDNILQNGHNFKAFMLYGADDFLISSYSKRITDTISGDKLTIYYDEYVFLTAKKFLQQQSLFDENNILIIKTDKKIAKKEIDFFVKLSLTNKHCYFIVEFYENIDDIQKSRTSARDCTKSFVRKKGVDNCRFFKLNPNESLIEIKNVAQKMNIEIENHALNHLLIFQNYDLALCVSELNKLSNLEHEITSKDIDMLGFNLSHTTIEELIDDFFNKIDLRGNVQKFLDEGGLERDLVNAISAYIVKLFEATTYMKIHGTFDAKVVLGYIPPKQIQEDIQGRAYRLDFAKYNTLFSSFGDLILELSSTKIDKESILMSKLNKIQAIL